VINGNKPIGTAAYLGGVFAVPEVFCWSWGQMVQYNAEYLCEPGQFVHYERAKASYHTFARNTLVDLIKGDWLLMLDTDHQFEPDIVARMLSLLDNLKIDVLTGLYCYKSPPYAPVLYQSNTKLDCFEPIVDWDQQVKCFEIASAGAGCLMVRKSVFDRIKDELHESPFDVSHPFSEDHSFFRRLQKLGIKAYCAPNIESHHLQIKPISYSEMDKASLNISKRQEVGGFA